MERNEIKEEELDEVAGGKFFSNLELGKTVLGAAENLLDEAGKKIGDVVPEVTKSFHVNRK